MRQYEQKAGTMTASSGFPGVLGIIINDLFYNALFP
jgi:hypothetical protein